MPLIFTPIFAYPIHRGPTIPPVGGTVTVVGEWTIHTFTSGGILSVLSPVEFEYLLVGGGGGGGDAGGGGGAVVRGEVELSVGNYTISVGSGGTGSNTAPTNGNASNIFSSDFSLYIEAPGGGHGGAGAYDNGKGGDGGSGGGGSGYSSNPVILNDPGIGSLGQNGSVAGLTDSGIFVASGAGGGSDPDAVVKSSPGVWLAGSTGRGGRGGDGTESSISGTPRFYGGGGGGAGAGTTSSVNHLGVGGAGGGGNGSHWHSSSGAVVSQAEAGEDGAGGGGGGSIGSGAVAANGGRGVVILRYRH